MFSESLVVAAVVAAVVTVLEVVRRAVVACSEVVALVHFAGG